MDASEFIPGVVWLELKRHRVKKLGGEKKKK
jgi:hypothetical protein